MTRAVDPGRIARKQNNNLMKNNGMKKIKERQKKRLKTEVQMHNKYDSKFSKPKAESFIPIGVQR